MVRSTFLVGALAFAAVSGLTACGDKVSVTGNPSDSVVTGVTVSPPAVTMKIGDKVTLAASVAAGSKITDRTVTWTSSNTAVATVDQNGVVTAVAGGTATVIAAAKANPQVQGAAAITVGAVVNATVTIANVNQTTCSFLGNCNSVPANLAAIMGQIDVTLNVDPGTQTISGIDLIMNCSGTGNSGQDTVIASQNIGSSDRAPLAEEAAAPVQLSFNTANFNSTSGVPSFKNGNCTIKGRVRTAQGTPAGSNTETLVLVNPDVIVGNMSSTKSALDPNTGLNWHGGDVTISALPVFFTPGRSAVSEQFFYEGKNSNVASGGAQSVTFLDTNNPASTNPLNIDNVTDPNSDITVAVITVDNSGNNFQNPNGFGVVTAASYLANPGNGGVPPFCGPACGGTNPFRLDTQKPISGGFTLASNTDQNTGPNGFLNAAFRFAGDSAAGYRGADRLLLTTNACVNAQSTTGVGTRTTTSNCDFGGVDSVTVIFQTGTTSAGTFTTVANPSSLAETATGTANLLRQITTDKLGNADTSWVCPGGACIQWAGNSAPASAKFGVDKTAPTATMVAGSEVNGTAYNAPAVTNYIFNITDPGTIGAAGVGTYAGPGTILVAQVREWNGFTTSSSVAGFENVNETNTPAANRPLLGETLGGFPAASNVPCVIGRFNAAQANAGPNALPVLAANGTTVGFCTPIPYTAGGPPTAQTIPSDANGLNGYYTTRIIAPDEANNLSAVFTATVLGDNSIPTIVNVDVPPTVAGNSTVSLPSSATDNAAAGVGDFVFSWPAVAYPSGIYQYAVTAGPGVAFDNVLTNSTTITPQIPNFIRNLQVNNGVAAPTATVANGTNATDFFVSAQDPSNNVGFKDVVIATQPTNFTGSATAWTNFTGGFAISASVATISNCPTAGCTGNAAPVNPLSTVITGVATGTTGIFTNPFVATQLWYRPTGSAVWFLAAPADVSAAGPSTSDNGLNRTWNFAFTFNPPVATPATHLGAPQTLTTNAMTIDVVVIGINANGDAIQTPTQVITITNP